MGDTHDQKFLDNNSQPANNSYSDQVFQSNGHPDGYSTGMIHDPNIAALSNMMKMLETSQHFGTRQLNLLNDQEDEGGNSLNFEHSFATQPQPFMPYNPYMPGFLPLSNQLYSPYIGHLIGKPLGDQQYIGPDGTIQDESTGNTITSETSEGTLSSAGEAVGDGFLMPTYPHQFPPSLYNGNALASLSLADIQEHQRSIQQQLYLQQLLQLHQQQQQLQHQLQQLALHTEQLQGGQKEDQQYELNNELNTENPQAQDSEAQIVDAQNQPPDENTTTQDPQLNEEKAQPKQTDGDEKAQRPKQNEQKSWADVTGASTTTSAPSNSTNSVVSKKTSAPPSSVPAPVAKPRAGSDKKGREKKYNPTHFDCNVTARFFVIKSFSEDDVHKSIKYNVWASTDNGNKRLDAAYKESHTLGPIYLFFSVNASGQFCGMAQMTSPLDYNTKCELWAQDKWNGQFSVDWIFIKDIPNGQLRHIKLVNNENKPVTNSRDTQEVFLGPGREVLHIFATYTSRTSILDDFSFYDKRQELMKEKKESDALSPKREGASSSSRKEFAHKSYKR